jgi:ribonuclease HI
MHKGLITARVGPSITGGSAKRRFTTQTDGNPLDLFKPAINACSVPAPRWVHTDSMGKVSLLVFTDGAAPNNGRADVRAGCGVVFRPDGKSSISFPLERSKDGHAPTSNRAELRAVIAALKLRYWPGEGFDRIVIGSDSEYVVRGICEWIAKWKRRGWRTAKGTPVKKTRICGKCSLKRWRRPRGMVSVCSFGM